MYAAHPLLFSAGKFIALERGELSHRPCVCWQRVALKSTLRIELKAEKLSSRVRRECEWLVGRVDQSQIGPGFEIVGREESQRFGVGLKGKDEFLCRDRKREREGCFEFDGA